MCVNLPRRKFCVPRRPVKVSNISIKIISLYFSLNNWFKNKCVCWGSNQLNLNLLEKRFFKSLLSFSFCFLLVSEQRFLNYLIFTQWQWMNWPFSPFFSPSRAHDNWHLTTVLNIWNTKAFVFCSFLHEKFLRFAYIATRFDLFDAELLRFNFED